MLILLISHRDLFSINVIFIDIILVLFPFENNIISTHIFCFETPVVEFK